MMLPNSSPVEVIQLLLGLVGVGIAFWKLWIAIENGLAITSTESTDLRRIVAETQVIGELFRLFAQGCLTAVGIISVLLPPPFPGQDEELMGGLQAFLTRAGLITLTLVLVLDSMVQEYRRRRFLVAVRNAEMPVVVAEVKNEPVVIRDNVDITAPQGEAPR